MTKDQISRRKFLKSSALGGTAAVGATLAAPAVLAQAPVTLKMQSSWPASDIFQEMAAQYVQRVQEMSNNRIKIDLLPAGAVVGAFQVQDACHDGRSMRPTRCRSTGTVRTRQPRCSAPVRSSAVMPTR